MTEITKAVPTTAREALQQCALLWNHIAEHNIQLGSEKEDLSRELFEYVPLHGCPACHWAYLQTNTRGDSMCNACPIDAWRGERRACLYDDESYALWSENLDVLESRQGALAVARLAQESIDTLDQQ